MRDMVRGNALRLPGAAKSLSVFWKKIADGADPIFHARSHTAPRFCCCASTGATLLIVSVMATVLTKHAPLAECPLLGRTGNAGIAGMT
jgi:hypothetical protein